MVVRAAVDRLGDGESFVLVADRNPAWIRRTVTRRTDAAVQWTTVRDGPGAWHVRVERGRGKGETGRR
jgi:uncharacterized protein (DUF2249 family)